MQVLLANCTLHRLPVYATPRLRFKFCKYTVALGNRHASIDRRAFSNDCGYSSVHHLYAGWDSTLIASNKPLILSSSLRVLHCNPFVRLYSGKPKRRLLKGVTKRPATRIHSKTLQLIDETGANLGEMEREMALQLAEGKGLEIVQIKKETSEAKAIFKLVSRKQIWDEEKRRKELNKRDPRNITKEVSITTNIGEHDLAVKVSHIREFLEKLHSVRVSVEVRRERGPPEQRQQGGGTPKERQVQLLEDISKAVEDIGSRVDRGNTHRNKLVCTFKSIL